LPRKRPERRIRTVPGARESRYLVGWAVLRACGWRISFLSIIFTICKQGDGGFAWDR
jgi:hypothetical protein